MGDDSENDHKTKNSMLTESGDSETDVTTDDDSENDINNIMSTERGDSETTYVTDGSEYDPGTKKRSTNSNKPINNVFYNIIRSGIKNRIRVDSKQLNWFNLEHKDDIDNRIENIQEYNELEMHGTMITISPPIMHKLYFYVIVFM